MWHVTAKIQIVFHQLYVSRDKCLFSLPPNKPVAKGSLFSPNMCGQALTSATGSSFQTTPCRGASKPNPFVWRVLQHLLLGVALVPPLCHARLQREAGVPSTPCLHSVSKTQRCPYSSVPSVLGNTPAPVHQQLHLRGAWRLSTRES